MKSYYTLIPYPGTKIAALAKKMNLIKSDENIFDDKINVQKSKIVELGSLDTGKMNRYHIVSLRYLWNFVFFRYSRKKILLRIKFLLLSIEYFYLGFLYQLKNNFKYYGKNINYWQ